MYYYLLIVASLPLLQCNATLDLYVSCETIIKHTTTCLSLSLFHTRLESLPKAGSSCCVSCAGLKRAWGGRNARHLINRCLNVLLKCPIDVRQLKIVISNKTKIWSMVHFPVLQMTREVTSTCIFYNIKDKLILLQLLLNKTYDFDGLGRWGSEVTWNENEKVYV